MRTRIGIFVLFIIVFAVSQAGAMGLLIPTEQNVPPLAIKYHRVKVELKDGAAVTTVEQTFVNSENRMLEATYIFPLPKGATIQEFALWMNGKRTVGEVLEKNQAKQIYEGIVRKMKDPGLIEWLDYDLFRARVFPIPANGEQKLELSFTQVLPFSDGLYEYVYPLKTSGKAARTLQDFTITTKIESKQPIRSIYSPTHKIYVSRSDDHKASVGFEQEGALLEKDFVLYYAVSEKDIGLNLLTYREGEDAGYFLMMISPKSEFREKEIVGKSVTFVVDTSGSMAGEKMDRAKAALKHCLSKLNPNDWFNVVRFSTDVEKFEKYLVPANDNNVKNAVKFVDQLEPSGGTAIQDALLAAMEEKREGTHIIIFITDGRPTVGETEPKKIIDTVNDTNKKKIRIFTFGIGDTINTILLDTLSRDNEGYSEYVKPNAEIEQTISAFYNKVSYPVMTDIQLAIDHIKPFGVLPGKMPDLFKGDQMIIVGRYRKAGDGLITLTGNISGEKKSFTYEGTFQEKEAANSFIPRLWANRQVGFLLNEIRLKGETAELKNEVIELARKFGIVTPYTSYLVVEQPKNISPIAQTEGDVDSTIPMEEVQLGNGGGNKKDGGSVKFYKSEPEMSEKVMDKKKMKEESGEDSITLSKALKKYEKSTVAKQSLKSRYVNNRLFQYIDGYWIDSKYKDGMKEIKIKYLSDAYFALLEAYPEVKAYLSLGKHVVLVVEGKAVIIGDEGKDDLNASQIKDLVK